MDLRRIECGYCRQKLTVAIPQTFLDTAVYPIYHASGLVFGYQTIGTAGTISIEASIKGSVFTMGAGAGEVDSITVYSNPSATTRTFGVAIYASSTLALVPIAVALRKHRRQQALRGERSLMGQNQVLAATTNYIIAEWGSSGSGTHVISYDTGTSPGAYRCQYGSVYLVPNPLVPSCTTNKYSIYATYTLNSAPNAPSRGFAGKQRYRRFGNPDFSYDGDRSRNK